MITLIKQNYKQNKKLYNKLVDQLKEKIDCDVPITHVGSTAIKNMYGKNIVDVLIGAKDKEQFEKLKQIIINMGYFASLNSQTEIYQFFASQDQETGNGDVHIHLVMLNTERYAEFIILKDYLTINKQEALAYSNHKKELVKKGIVDRKEYRAQKSKYVTELIKRAKEYFIKKSHNQ